MERSYKVASAWARRVQVRVSAQGLMPAQAEPCKPGLVQERQGSVKAWAWACLEVAASCLDAEAWASASAGNLEDSPSAGRDNPSASADNQEDNPLAADIPAALLPWEVASCQAAWGNQGDSPSDIREAASCQAAWGNQEDNPSAAGPVQDAAEDGPEDWVGQKVSGLDP